MAHQPPSPHPQSQAETPERSAAFERILFFSDAIFAIAITLLALELRLPELPGELSNAELGHELLALWPKYFSYVLSFMVIGIYWTTHHLQFRYIVRYNRRLVWLNLLLLLCIAFLPFPTALLGTYLDQRTAVIIYAASLAAVGFVKSGLWWYASKDHRLLDENLDPKFIRFLTLRGLAPPLVFLCTIPIAFISLSVATLSWLLTYLLNFVIRPPKRWPSDDTPVRNDKLGLDRIIFFSDGVFAIAITLLVVDIHVPEIPSALASTELLPRLVELVPQFLSYVLSFAVIGVTWVGHHRTFSYIHAYNRPLIGINLIFLLCIGFLPFPTAVLGEHASLPWSAVLYAATVAVTIFMKGMVWWYAASGQRLVGPTVTPEIFRFNLVQRNLIPIAVFLLSIPLAFISIDLARFSWLLIFIAYLVFKPPDAETID